MPVTALGDMLEKGQRIEAHRPYPRANISAAAWQLAAQHLAEGRLTLLSLWGEPAAVSIAVLGEGPGEAAVLTLECAEGRFASIGRLHPPAQRLERTVRDLFGLEAEGLPDTRAWLDHGRWGIARPLGDAGEGPGPTAYAFLPAEGESLHQIPVGPVHAGIIEPGHFRFTANGETVVRLEERLGYAHKGIEGLMRGADIARAARLAGRTSGDSTVAYAFAFARAVEAALGIEVPRRGQWLRALMAELERLANHFGDIGAICNDASFSLLHAHFGVLREHTLRAAEACFGHRLMRDCVQPGGVAEDLPKDGAAVLKTYLEETKRRFPSLVALYDRKASLQDRTVGTGILRPALARQFGAGGYVGRASGRGFDVRKDLPYAPYDSLNLEVPVLEQGDVNARVWIRIREVEQSMELVGRILEGLPAGAIQAGLTRPGDGSGEGMALVEGFRGDVLVWLRLEAGKIARCHLRDPSWFQWPLLEAAIEGNIVADFPLCNKSFNCSYSGHDL